MKIFLSLFAILYFSAMSGQNDKPMREPFRLQLSVDNDQYYGMDVAKTPYFVKEKIVQVYPGENLFIEAEMNADTIFSMKVVEKNLKPEKTIELKFYQELEDKKHAQMYLVVKNPFKKSLNYNAAMYTVEGKDWQETSIIPILPGLTNYEMWQNRIITLVLHSWRLEN